MTDRSHRVLRRAAVVLAIAFGLLCVTPRAHADPPVAQGWWWFAQAETIPLPAQVADLIPEQAGPPGVPEAGLYVAGNALGEEAVSTVKFFVRPGSSPVSLDLEFAEAPVGVPIIRLCQVTTEWIPVQQGAWSSRPTFSCAEDAPVGTVSDDGMHVSFDLSGLDLDGMVDFGLAPGLDDLGNPSTFQAPIVRPGVDALRFDDAGDDVSVPVTAATPSSPTAAPPATALRLPQAPAATGGVNLAPVATRSVAPVSSGTDFAAAAPVTTLPMVPASSSDNDLRTIGMIGLFGLAAFYAWLGGQKGREPTSLLSFGSGSGPVIDAEALR